jgi:hypothetical protein
MTRQQRALYYVTRTVEKLPNPRDNRTTTICDETYTYDYDDASDIAFKLAFSEAFAGNKSELTCVNTTPNTYCVFHPTTHTRTLYTVQVTDDGIDLL